MVRVLSLATLAVAIFSFTNVIAHPSIGVPNHRAIARRASASKTAVAKAATTSSKKTTTSSKKTTTSSKKATTTSSSKKTTTTSSKKTTTTTHSSKKATTTTSSKKATTATSSKKATTTTSSKKTTITTTSSKKTTTTTTSSKKTTTTTSSKTTTKTTTSTTSTSSASAATHSISPSDGLLPATGVLAGWTVAGTSPNVDSLVLSNSTFTITKEIKSLSHEVVAIDGKNAIHGHVKQGSYGLSNATTAGGFSFYTPGPKNTKVDLTKATEISFAYSVKFSAGYGWNLGGKLPGLYGGVNASIAATCSGGRHDDGCFSCRFMWRDGGKGELYLYLPPDYNRANLCGDDGYGECIQTSDNGVTYGASVGTGLWDFKDGDWVTVRQVVHLNTPGLQDGWVQVYVDGSTEPIVSVEQISFRNSTSGVFYGIQAQYFHGGHEEKWAAPQDQDAWFADFSVAITQYSS